MVTKKQWEKFIRRVKHLKGLGFQVNIAGYEVWKIESDRIKCLTLKSGLYKTYSHPDSFTNHTKIARLYDNLRIKKGTLSPEFIDMITPYFK